MHGYEAGYYGYMLSLDYATNLYYKHFKGQELNSEKGMLYRKKILEPGSTKDGLDLLRDFLGEEPCSDYFLIDNGLLKQRIARNSNKKQRVK